VLIFDALVMSSDDRFLLLLLNGAFRSDLSFSLEMTTTKE
jgi:hypothetical protein